MGAGIPAFQLYELERSIRVSSDRINLSLLCQFDDRPRGAALGSLQGFADAVDWTNPKDPCHLNWYGISKCSDPDDPIRVNVTSPGYSDGADIVLQGLRGLLVPTRKRLRPDGSFSASPKLSHFKVYAVASAPPPEEEDYRVHDQFGRRGFRLQTPVAMGIPVLKGGPRKYSFIRDHVETHLLIHPIDPVDPTRARIDSFDQFVKHRDVQLRSAKYYASPAIKRRLPRLPSPGGAVPR